MTGVLELEPEAFYAFGDSVELDGKGSWMPADGSGYQPIQSYLLVDGDAAVIIDPGPAIVREPVVEGLARAVPAPARPPIFLTRYQLDVIGNLAAVAAQVPLGTVYSGGVSNPFDSFDQVTAADGSAAASQLEVARIPAGGSVTVREGRELQVVTPMLRILTTFWAYDEGTGTLFTSDSFVHGMIDRPGERPVIDDRASDPTTVEDVGRHLLAAFGWLQFADITPIAEHLEAVFEDHDVARIAPSRGCVLEGREVVGHHRDMLITALRRIEEERP